MKILIQKETTLNEKRVAITADLISKYNKLGYEILIESGAGLESNILDQDYQNAGATIVKDIASVIADIDIILKVQAPSDLEIKEISGCKKDVLLLGMLNPYQNQEKNKLYKELGLKAFAAELFPRISRAQGIDVLSSQSNLVGYRAVIDAVYELGVAMPMMMTAAGTITPAKVMVLGVGVAGLQAIATAKRLGAVVSAFDVRPSTKEQVQSLGAKFIEVTSEMVKESSSGYALEMSDDYKKKQEQLIFDNIIKQDIVISTALIPGKPAPKLISEEMVKAMKNGAVIVDIAAINGGNCELTNSGKMIEKFGIKIIGYDNFASRIARDASKLYAKNLYNFVEMITNKTEKKIVIDLEDEIIKASLL